MRVSSRTGPRRWLFASCVAISRAAEGATDLAEAASETRTSSPVGDADTAVGAARARAGLCVGSTQAPRRAASRHATPRSRRSARPRGWLRRACPRDSGGRGTRSGGRSPSGRSGRAARRRARPGRRRAAGRAASSRGASSRAPGRRAHGPRGCGPARARRRARSPPRATRTARSAGPRSCPRSRGSPGCCPRCPPSAR